MLSTTPSRPARGQRPKTDIIIQARMGSTRLPGKVLSDLCGEPMLGHIVRRCQVSQSIDEVLVATSSLSVDEQIVRFCQSRGIPFYRGSPTDVLDRYFQAACQLGSEVIVRVTADCPLVDPGVVDTRHAVEVLLADPGLASVNAHVVQKPYRNAG